MLFWAIFQSKSKSFHLFVVIFLRISASWESYVNPGRAITGSPPCFLMVAGESYSMRHGNLALLGIEVKTQT
jgi:hypothetical protein